MRKRLLNALEHGLRAQGLWRRDAALLAGVSGGADSVALLWGLCQLRQEMPFRLICCHVQHGLRGENSLGDQLFVENLCREWNVECRVADAGLTGDMHTPGMESLAREKRRQLFARWMAEFSADALLLAHHGDDQAETLLMHLLRGSGLRGLGGMEAARPFGSGVLLRPLLHFSKADLLDILRQEGIPFREDESNREATTPRNALRLNVLPRMEQLYPGASRRIASATDSLCQDEACLTALADDLFCRAHRRQEGVFALEVSPLLSAPAALAVRALRRFYREGAALLPIAPGERDLSHEDSQRLLSLLQEAPGYVANLPNDMEICRGVAHLFLLKQGGEPIQPWTPPEPAPIARGSMTLSGCAFCLEDASPGWTPSAMSVLLTPEEASAAVLRHPLPGDVIRPLGASGSKPLRRWLMDRKIDLPLRPSLPVLAMGREILWVPGVTCAESLRRESPDGLFILRILNPEHCLYLQKE